MTGVFLIEVNVILEHVGFEVLSKLLKRRQYLRNLELSILDLHEKFLLAKCGAK